jgi:hypothetical protein
MNRSLVRTLVVLLSAGLGAVSGLALAHPGPEAEARRAERMAQHEAMRAAVQAEVLQRLDSDRSGSISQDEIDAAAAARAAEVDANGDGRIEAAELAAFREAKRAEARVRRQQRQLERLDADGDGSVSAEEFAAAQVQRLRHLDRDGNGEISADELGGRRHHRRHGG